MRTWLASLILTCGLTAAGAAMAQLPPPPPPPPGYEPPGPAQPATEPPGPNPGAPGAPPAYAPPPGYGQGYAPPAYPPPPAYTYRYGYPPPAGPPPDPTRHTHDGFYLRMGIGGGYLSDKSSIDGPFGNGTDRSTRGSAVAFELSLGGTPLPGFVVGVGIASCTVPNPTTKTGDVKSTDADAQLNLSTMGLLADYYFDPSGGAHAQAIVGFGGLDATNKNGDIAGEKPSGFAMTFGGGYEWWVGEQWGIGVLGRLTYASLTWTSDSNTIETRHRVVVPAVLFTATYH